MILINAISVQTKNRFELFNHNNKRADVKPFLSFRISNTGYIFGDVTFFRLIAVALNSSLF